MDRGWRSLFWLTLFAVAMAYLEAAIVVYLRQAYYAEHVLEIFPPRMLSEVDMVVELGREVATLVMILAVASLVARGVVAVFAAFVYIFGVWDIFYYVWLKVTIGWPASWAEWDILFLIPWAWAGPWLTAVAIALLFVLWGGAVHVSGRTCRMTARAVISFLAGTVLTIAAFLQPAVPYLPGGMEAVAEFRPDGFWWPLYLAGYALMALGLTMVLRPAKGVNGSDANDEM